MKIGIIGMGHVGATLAYTLCLQGLADELVLIDTNEMKVQAEYLELSDTVQNLNHHVKLIKNDYAALENAAIVVFCAGDIRVLETATDRLAELRVTSKIVEDISPKLKASGFSGIVISITNPCDVIALYLANMTGFDKAKIIGSGTLIDTNRLKHRAERDDVLVIGEHGESQVALNVSSEVEKLATGTGWEIYAAKHHTAFGISSSVARIIRVLKTDTRELLPVSSYDESENCFYATLTEFNLKDGVIRRILPPLNNSETNRLAQSIQTIKRNYLEI
ncbi:MAG: lactate/malate family dehydrogenase [Pseudolactococcus laudensis]|uniref:NAD(P)-binding domain-containing protein n=1 Tax=Pseudolactococcus laudensis TaxID=1494461 RepID=A0A7V8MZ72_9LACT|nr:NAD(P)-binding domain-containing protein [Lactococcus laudensis]MBA0015769.1 NAD(P)-binding domain-containing protein [Lactococcus laudensis]MBQ6144786.1 NAD(P)-binding domain-containing protein [Lactococcus sp.]MBR2762953.1 NAD(P)-binding domain-containing protein [Lactococcus sp.]MBW9280756.1 L-lactate dehydrogenase [Lactococcus laudensis]